MYSRGGRRRYEDFLLRNRRHTGLRRLAAAEPYPPLHSPNTPIKKTIETQKGRLIVYEYGTHERRNDDILSTRYASTDEENISIRLGFLPLGCSEICLSETIDYSLA